MTSLSNGPDLFAQKQKTAGVSLSYHCFKHALLWPVEGWVLQRNTPTDVWIENKRSLSRGISSCDYGGWQAQICRPETQRQAHTAVQIQRLFAADFSLAPGRSIFLFHSGFSYWAEASPHGRGHLLSSGSTDFNVNLIQRSPPQKHPEYCLTGCRGRRGPARWTSQMNHRTSLPYPLRQGMVYSHFQF